MGSATTQARSATLAALAAAGDADLATGEQILEIGRVIGDSAQLQGVLTDPSIAAGEKSALVDRLFGATTATARAVVSAAVSSGWSDSDDLLAGLEEAGIRALAASAPDTASVDAELFAFEAAVASDQELELAISAKLGSSDGKASLVSALVSGKASPQTIAILEQLVRQPRGRRIGTLIADATRIVAEQSGTTLAIVTTATALSAAQLDRLAAALTASAGRTVRINPVVDPAVVGGVRVRIGDDVIDGTVASKLSDLKLQLAR
ncbi:F0F1 ATP synthase subunit delta [Galbitalea sp. SE-J8]|uniref:F0F1 ATP synthase subunit delta n=1 Tax=Galbitalea sp. SE-J8 TaxID=3054952 RepID=UPI00259CE678|nr:F0F1 ATP synthase subunit delta [Galbitalea sp. SE-J8]MDM4763454.1 F0F1 ATP synthase subunit delta [Galbitalea sp. SE-J8]